MFYYASSYMDNWNGNILNNKNKSTDLMSYFLLCKVYQLYFFTIDSK